MTIASNSIMMHVEDQGTGSPALVFLHYWGGSSRTWRHVVSALAPSFRTVAIDQRGWGRSDAPEAGYALTDLAADAEGVIGALGLDRYVLVGHSMGGKVAQLLASRRPAGMAGLVLVAPSPPTPLALSLEVRQGMVGAYETRDSIVATVKQVLTAGPLAPDDLDAVVSCSLRGASPAKAAWPLVTSQEDISDAASRIAVPTLVLSGEEDRVDPPSVLKAELLPRIPQAKLHIFSGVGHLLPLEAPADVAGAIRAFALSLNLVMQAC